jgi:hypothetical protein
MSTPKTPAAPAAPPTDAEVLAEAQDNAEKVDPSYWTTYDQRHAAQVKAEQEAAVGKPASAPKSSK